jgi:GTP-binding protein
MGNIVAIVGRPNVGKSTFFNRMLGMRKAIVDDVSGVTRDRQYGSTDWNGQKFMVVDTGGFIGDSDDEFAAAIRDQIQIAVSEANVVLFMVDVATGVTDLDEQVAEMLHRSKKRYFAGCQQSRQRRSSFRIPRVLDPWVRSAVSRLL